MPRKTEGSASAPVSRASAAADPYPSATARKSTRAGGAGSKRVKYISASDEDEDEAMLLVEEEDDDEGGGGKTPVAQQRRGAKAIKAGQSSFARRAADAVLRETAKEKVAEAADFSAKLKAAIGAGQAGADKLIGDSKLKIEKKFEQLTLSKAPRFTLVGEPESYRNAAFSQHKGARRLADMLQKYNLKLLNPEDDLHEAVSQMFTARIERTQREQRKLDKVVAKTAADYHAAAQNADGSYNELRKYLKRTARV
ncbi:hypothetical protein JCM10908_004393 [Rhodotorula pacifica]|uniref:uncharacterized protein n=1 Tax=Rhodotorula pacifica TaxID=1495444 RepID=UPI00317B53D8